MVNHHIPIRFYLRRRRRPIDDTHTCTNAKIKFSSRPFNSRTNHVCRTHCCFNLTVCICCIKLLKKSIMLTAHNLRNLGRVGGGGGVAEWHGCTFFPGVVPQSRSSTHPPPPHRDLVLGNFIIDLCKTIASRSVLFEAVLYIPTRICL